MDNKLEHYQLMQKICMYGIPGFLILSAICGWGWNHYGLKIKVEEARIAKENKEKQTEQPSSVFNIKGDYVAGDKKTKTNQTKIMEDNSVNKQHNSNTGTNSGAIGGSGNVVGNNNRIVQGNNYGINGDVTGNVTFNQPQQIKSLSPEAQASLLKAAEEVIAKNPNAPKTFLVLMAPGSNLGYIRNSVIEILNNSGFIYKGDLITPSNAHDGIIIDYSANSESFVVSFGSH